MLTKSRESRPSPAGGPLGPTPRLRRQPFSLSRDEFRDEAEQAIPLPRRPLPGSTPLGARGALQPRDAFDARRGRRGPRGTRYAAEEEGAGEKKNEGGANARRLPFETQVQNLFASGLARPRDRLRLSGLNRSRPLLIARLPDDLAALSPPITIQQDIPILPVGEEGNTQLRLEGEKMAPWRISDSSDLKDEKQEDGSSRRPREEGDDLNTRKKQKVFVSKPNDVNADCFFLLVQGKEFVEVLPISGWLNFDRTVVSKGEEVPTAEDAEYQSRAKAAQEAALAARLAQLRRGGAESDEEGERGAKDSAKSAKRDGSPDGDNDDLGLRRQKQKRMKQLLRQKAGHNQKLNEYIDSALSVTALRQAEVDWDFEEGERSDDEEDVATEVKQQQGAEGEDLLAGHEAAEDLVVTDDEDAAGVADAADLTNYGQKMKTLLDKAKDDEADDELHQFESDEGEENEEGEGATAAAAGAPAVGGAASASSSSPRPPSSVSASSAAPSGKPVVKPGGSAVQSAAPKAAEDDADLKSRVIRIMQQHMGRMTVKHFMSAFKVKEKNEEFKKIQQVVHKICKMETTEDKQKFIILKPEYRM
ncbi:hypothetical protein BESB_020140 [Besnoitia besnoiti]|uniref:Transcription initiation factor IIF subunit alpha n=1 Tax=Besnoitia besnoiti TaxID=94643 RepID=A0A2A9M8Q5_BESBE|nr:hypothetical protein BESB_020140 [Besnoitia besnoiti]PFH32073.1 hypothetical protein BESB_020140 [Besnoitia besnoiti]